MGIHMDTEEIINLNNFSEEYDRNTNIDNDIEKVIKLYPAKVTSYLRELIIRYPSTVGRQFLPSPEELTSNGTDEPFESGKHCAGVHGLERVYRDRVIIIPVFDCPAYCRFCFRKSRVQRSKRPMDENDIKKAVEYISNNPEIRGVLITGGDPFLDLDRLDFLLTSLMSIDHIYDIRIGTRSLLYRPHIFTDELIERLNRFNVPDYVNPTKSKSLAINVHFNHPDELTPEAIRTCHKFVSKGIILRNQTVLLKGINDDPDTIITLFSILIRNRIIPYYLNHCMPVVGSDHFRTSVARGIEIMEELFKLSSTLCPNYVFATEVGKVHVINKEVLDYDYKGDQKFIRTRMVYNPDEFFRYTNQNSLPGRHYIDEHGCIIGYYRDGND